MHCLKYGLTVHNILKLRAFTIEGELLEIGGDGLDAAGYDLLALMTGSEGLLAVITEVTVKLLPKPECAQVVLAAFDDIEKAAAAVANVIAAGIIPAGLEMMDQAATRAVEEFVHAGYPTDVAGILLCESDGTREEVADEIRRIQDVMEASGAILIRASRDEAERLRFWAGRKAAFPAVGRISPDYYCMDGTIPRKRVGEVLRGIAEMEKKYGLRCANVFHAGDGNLHPLILYDANQPGELERTEAFGGEILELSIKVGGTITGEHGVGIEKIDYMCLQFRPAELAAFHGVKTAFDEHTLLNPGKAVPTLARCAEFGRMHVHTGQEKFPDLPRFLKPFCKTVLKSFMQEIINQLTDTIRAAAASKTPLCIRGGGSKDFYGGPLRGEALDRRRLSRHRRLRADRARDHRARRHAARRDRSRACAKKARCSRSSRRISAFRPHPLPGEGNVVPAAPEIGWPHWAAALQPDCPARAALTPARRAISCSACACSTAQATICVSAARS